MLINDSILRLSLLGFSLALSACVTPKITVVDERTALENQILGQYEELDGDLLLIASVRSETSGEAGGDEALSPRTLKELALEARRDQQFNKDDLEESKGWGCLGEGRDGHISLRDCQKQKDPATAERLKKLVETENHAREVILRYLLKTSAALKPSDRPQLVETYARVQRELSPVGTWLQSPDGSWTQKEVTPK